MKEMVFWRIESPEYESDYDDTFINGHSKHDFGLPGIKCRLCGETWSSTRILPYKLPKKLQAIPELSKAWPIYEDEHKRLRECVQATLKEEGIEIDELLPGDKFQPAYLDIPSIPSWDFIWSDIGSVLVSERVKEIFNKNKVCGVEFVPVVLKRVGNNLPVLPAPVPSTGEPEDIFDEIEYVENFEGVSKYYEIVVFNRSKRPPGAEILSRCKSCNREEYDSSKRVLTMNQDMWNGDDVFMLPTTLWIVITDKMKKVLEDNRMENVKFTKL